MKTFLLAAITALSFFTASAQQKIAYINTDELIGSMPEAIKADAELNEYKQGLGQQYQDLSADFAAKDSAFVRDSVKLSASIKKIKRDELLGMYQRLSNWQEEANQMYQQEANVKIAPIREKAMKAIEAVAAEKGYGYVLDEGNLLVKPAGDNLLPFVKKKLGIVDKPAAVKPGVKPMGN